MSQQAVAEGPPPAAEKPAPFPHHYEVALDWPGHGPGVLSSSPRPAILGGPPPQFQGSDTWWSPEHLLLSAASLCLQTTFQFFAAKEGLKVSRYASRIEGILDKTPTGIAFTSIALQVELAVQPGEVQRAAQLLQTAKKYCIVANSLKTPVDLRVSVTAA